MDNRVMRPPHHRVQVHPETTWSPNDNQVATMYVGKLAHDGRIDTFVQRGFVFGRDGLLLKTREGAHVVAAASEPLLRFLDTHPDYIGEIDREHWELLALLRSYVLVYRAVFSRQRVAQRLAIQRA